MKNTWTKFHGFRLYYKNAWNEVKNTTINQWGYKTR